MSLAVPTYTQGTLYGEPEPELSADVIIGGGKREVTDTRAIQKHSSRKKA